MLAAFHQLLRYLPPILIVASLPGMISAVKSVRSDTTDMRQWLPDSGSGRESFDWFVDRFGYDDIAFVSWPDCTRDDDRLSKLKSSVSANDREQLIERVTTGTDLLNKLMSPPLNLSRRSAMQRLHGTFLGPSGTTGLIVHVTEAGIEDPNSVLNLIQYAATGSCGIAAEDLRFGGGVYEAVQIDVESVNSFRKCIVLSMLAGAFVALVSLRRLPLVLGVLLCGAYCSGLSIALISMFGATINSIMLVMPALIYVLVVSSSVHLVNYYLDVVSDGIHSCAARRTLQIGWLPCTLACVTTAVGMLTLSASSITHIRSFGVFSAASLLVALCVSLAFIYSMIDLWWSRPRRTTGSADSSEAHGEKGSVSSGRHGPASERGHSAPKPSAVTTSSSPHLSQPLASVVLRHHDAIVIAASILVIAFSVGLWRTRSSVSLDRIFAPENELMRNYRWIEEQVGPLGAVEVVVRFDGSTSLSMVERLAFTSKLESKIKDIEQVGGTHSAATFLPRVPDAKSLSATIRRAAMNRMIIAGLDDFVRDGVIYDSADEQLWRITARVSLLDRLPFEQVVNQIDQLFHRSMNDIGEEYAGTSYRVAGTMLVLEQSKRMILDDLMRSFILAFAIICPIMMLVLRSATAGLITMVPNCLPAILIFGSMGWLQIPIDIGTVLTASVALGIAVDDTFHFLTWFRRGLHAGLDRTAAIRSAYRRCTVAMVQTTLICGLGLLPFLASSFLPTGRFAILMFALLAAALLGDLIVLPAILASRVGRLFEFRR